MKVFAFTISIIIVLLIGFTSFIDPSIYSSIVWKGFWGLILIALIYAIVKWRMWRNLPVFILHISFVVIIFGGILTSLLSIRGTLHLSPGIITEEFQTSSNSSLSLPSPLTLEEFKIIYYEGTDIPKDFISAVKVSDNDRMLISMNKIGTVNGYRFYQTSFDGNGGSILTVTYDPFGITVVYIGFALFVIAGGWMLLQKFRFKSRLSSPKIIAGSVIAVAILSSPSSVSAARAITPAQADSLSTIPVVFNGDVVPFSTFATKLTYKLTGRSNIGGLSPEAFVGSLIIYKDDWFNVPFLKVKSKGLRDKLNIKGNYVAINDLYDNRHNYLPGLIYQGGTGEYDKDILLLDEKIELLMKLWKGELCQDARSSSLPPRSAASIKAEVLYNRFIPQRLLFILTITCSFLAITIEIIRPKVKLWWMAMILAILAWIFILWKWYYSGSFPISTTPDMMQFAATVIATIGIWISYRLKSSVITGIVLLAAAFLFLVSWIGVKDPIMSPLMPVLASPWLSIHVSIIMISYAILGLTCPMSLCALLFPRLNSRLSITVEKMLLPGTYLLGVGIIIGAMWANVSWGRYWAWDPKETWALVTLMLYAIPLHRLLGLKRESLSFHLYIILIFLSIIMTYEGVNYLPSIHAYK